jgi:hypothetical protein
VLNLNSFKYNNYSANGEDGILNYLSSVIKFNKPPFVVEFGAWDGKLDSNTFNLVLNSGAEGVFIEKDPVRFEELSRNMSSFKNTYLVNKEVSFESNSPDSLDSILVSCNTPINFDILSIDIDSDDALVLLSLQNFYPKILIIECNSSFLPGVYFFNTDSIDGNSFSTIVKIAEGRGYKLVAHTGNLIFVREEYFKATKLENFIRDYPEFLFDTQYINTKREVPETLSRILFRLSSFYLKLRG